MVESVYICLPSALYSHPMSTSYWLDIYTLNLILLILHIARNQDTQFLGFFFSNKSCVIGNHLTS